MAIRLFSPALFHRGCGGALSVLQNTKRSNNEIAPAAVPGVQSDGENRRCQQPPARNRQAPSSNRNAQSFRPLLPCRLSRGGAANKRTSTRTTKPLTDSNPRRRPRPRAGREGIQHQAPDATRPKTGPTARPRASWPQARSQRRLAPHTKTNHGTQLYTIANTVNFATKTAHKYPRTPNWQAT